ncbi:MAG TPA: phosphopantetheine-binding protein [Actinocrinis sp.]|jgi:acyl carrier protein
MSVYETVTKIFADSFRVPADQISAASTMEELELDSLELVELSLLIEQELGVTLSDEQLAERNLDVGGLCETISTLLGAGAR